MKIKTGATIVAVLAVVQTMFYLGLIGGGAYVAFHFIHKFW